MQEMYLRFQTGPSWGNRLNFNPGGEWSGEGAGVLILKQYFLICGIQDDFGCCMNIVLS